jgi:hypothetical protein
VAGDVQDYTYGPEEFLNSVEGSKALLAFKSEADSFPRVETALTDGGLYDNVTEASVPNDDVGTDGGPGYVEVGLDEVLEYTGDTTGSGRRLTEGGNTLQEWTLYNYNPSSVEFFSYVSPTI